MTEQLDEGGRIVHEVEKMCKRCEFQLDEEHYRVVGHQIEMGQVRQETKSSRETKS